eukprot:gene13393-17958_t
MNKPKILSNTRLSQFNKPFDGLNILSLREKFTNLISTNLSPVEARRTLFGCSMVYGSNYITTKLLQNVMSPVMVNFVRFLIASLFFLPDLFRSSRKSLKSIFIGMELGFWCGMGFMTQAIALKVSSASKTSFFCGLTVIMPPLFDFVESTFKTIISSLNSSNLNNNMVINSTSNISEKSIGSGESNPMYFPKTISHMIKSPIISPMLAICGAIVLEWGGMEAPNLSDLYLLVTPLCFAMNFWKSARYSALHPEDTKVITGSMLLSVSFLSCLMAVQQKQFFPFKVNSWIDLLRTIVFHDWRILALFLLNGIVATAWTTFSEQRAMKVLSANETTLIYSMEPIFATLFAWMFLNEHVGINTCLGAVFIISACMWDTISDLYLRSRSSKVHMLSAN